MLKNLCFLYSKDDLQIVERLGNLPKGMFCRERGDNLILTIRGTTAKLVFFWPNIAVSPEMLHSSFGGGRFNRST